MAVVMRRESMIANDTLPPWITKILLVETSHSPRPRPRVHHPPKPAEPPVKFWKIICPAVTPAASLSLKVSPRDPRTTALAPKGRQEEILPDQRQGSRRLNTDGV